MTLGQRVTALRLWILTRRDDVRIGSACRISGSARFFARGGRIRIGDRCEIGAGAIFNCHGGSITIGDACSVNELSILYGHGGLTIGNGVRIAAHVVIIPSNHQMRRDQPIHRQPLTKLGITIEDDVWIGAGAKILDGVTLAQGSVIGAGSVVTRSTEPYSIHVGVPARQIGRRS